MSAGVQAQEQSTPSTQAKALGVRSERRKKAKTNRKFARNFILLESGHEFEEAKLRIGLRYILSAIEEIALLQDRS